MNLTGKIQYVLLAGIMTMSLLACKKSEDCSDSSANLPAPIPQTRYRIVDSVSRDLLAASTPGHLSFDSLVAVQPCNAKSTLNKHKFQAGAGNQESYVFNFDDLYQPITGENKECFTLRLNWGVGNTDVVTFSSRAEHHVCGVTFYLDAVTFNGKIAQKDADGNYILRR